jgi:predicted nucleic acid-binding protein
VRAALVVDSSAAMAWFMPDEITPESETLRRRVTDEGAAVPVLWRLEIGNTFLLAVRHRRISLDQRIGALEQLATLPISIDDETLTHAWGDTLAIAERFRLTLYEACYLELALRRGLPLASLDRDLRKAAVPLNIELLGV